MQRPRRVERSRVALAAAAALFCVSSASIAQDEPASKPESAPESAPARRPPRRPPGAGTGASIVLENARVLRPGKPDLEGAMVVVRGRKIVAVGKKVDVPPGARRIDVKGATVTAG